VRRTALSFALLLVCLSGCASSSAGTVKGVRLVAKDRLTTCTHLPYAPFQFRQGTAIVGFDVDMMDLVAKRLGVRQRVVNERFEPITNGQALNDGTCDVAAAGMTINGARANVVDFSEPYFTASQVIMARKGSGITGLRRGVRFGVVAGTTSEDFVRSKGIVPKSYETSATELDALRTDQVDAVVQDDPVVRYWLTDPANSAFAMVADLHTGERYGYAVRKGHDPALIRLIDQVIDQARRDGTYRRIYQKWMGPMPGGVAS
jgi:polar amino acid transport system substrate-binding protein